jgi:hypothetical protein
MIPIILSAAIVINAGSATTIEADASEIRHQAQRAGASFVAGIIQCDDGRTMVNVFSKPKATPQQVCSNDHTGIVWIQILMMPVVKEVQAPQHTIDLPQSYGTDLFYIGPCNPLCSTYNLSIPK